jgi:hypothetical protein
MSSSLAGYGTIIQGSESSTLRLPNESISKATALPFPETAPRTVDKAS